MGVDGLGWGWVGWGGLGWGVVHGLVSRQFGSSPGTSLARLVLPSNQNAGIYWRYFVSGRLQLVPRMFPAGPALGWSQIGPRLLLPTHPPLNSPLNPSPPPPNGKQDRTKDRNVENVHIWLHQRKWRDNMQGYHGNLREGRIYWVLALGWRWGGMGWG